LRILKNNYRKFYQRNIQISYIIALMLFIILFYLFPRSSWHKADLPDFKPIFQVIDIPPTRQVTHARPKRPAKPVIPVQGDESQLLNYVEITSDKAIQGDDSLFIQGLPLSYKPRLILEVIPKNIDENISGEIILQLKIGSTGKVKNYRVIKNTTNSPLYLKEAIQAAQKSIWEAAVVNGQPVEYWIDKIYRFNM
jgi:hypothetical protein